MNGYYLLVDTVWTTIASLVTKDTLDHNRSHLVYYR